MPRIQFYVVLGGAGTGKTTVAAAVVRKILDHQRASGAQPRRALFLSFSRAAVGQIVDRTNGTLGRQAGFVEITTFHAFAWHLIRRWGSTIGLPDPKLISPSEAKLFGTSSGITYDELLPLALKLLDIPAVRKHLERRWAVIVSDEFQDTSHDQFELIMRLRGQARLVLLGDLNQCIYTNLPGVVGVGPERVAAALTLPGAREIRLRMSRIAIRPTFSLRLPPRSGNATSTMTPLRPHSTRACWRCDIITTYRPKAHWCMQW